MAASQGSPQTTRQDDADDVLRWWGRAGLVAGGVGGAVAALAGQRVGAVNLALGSLSAVALLKLLELTVRKLSRTRHARWTSSLAISVPKYALVAVALYAWAVTGYFRPLWFVGGFALVHLALLARALQDMLRGTDASPSATQAVPPSEQADP